MFSAFWKPWINMLQTVWKPKYSPHKCWLFFLPVKVMYNRNNQIMKILTTKYNFALILNGLKPFKTLENMWKYLSIYLIWHQII